MCRAIICVCRAIVWTNSFARAARAAHTKKYHLLLATQFWTGGAGFLKNEKRRGGDGARPAGGYAPDDNENANRAAATPEGPPVLIRTSLGGYSPEDLTTATPALILKGDNLTTIFDLDRATHGTKRQKPLSEMSENVGKRKATGRANVGNAHYNQQYDRWGALSSRRSSAPMGRRSPMTRRKSS